MYDYFSEQKVRLSKYLKVHLNIVRIDKNTSMFLLNPQPATENPRTHRQLKLSTHLLFLPRKPTMGSAAEAAAAQRQWRQQPETVAALSVFNPDVCIVPTLYTYLEKVGANYKKSLKQHESNDAVGIITVQIISLEFTSPTNSQPMSVDPSLPSSR